MWRKFEQQYITFRGEEMNGINIRLGVTKKDIEIITTALREYAKNHPNPKCHAYEANDIAKIIENQSKREVEE